LLKVSNSIIAVAHFFAAYVYEEGGRLVMLANHIISFIMYTVSKKQH